MNNELEKLRGELKNKIDEIIDKYISDDSSIMNVPEDNIYMEFELDGQNYVAFTEDQETNEELNMMFAKVSLLDESRILRNVEDRIEYEKVVQEFYRRLKYISD